MNPDQSPYALLTRIEELGFDYFVLSKDFDVSMSFLKADVRLPVHSHDADVYAQILNGELTLVRNQRREAYARGTWFLIPAGQEHAVETEDEVTLLELWRK